MTINMNQWTGHTATPIALALDLQIDMLIEELSGVETDMDTSGCQNIATTNT
jgi:hypothetical protein